MITAEELLNKASASAKRHYKFNTKFRKPAKLINGQGKCEVSKHKFGLCRMSFNGCAPIAVYNALLCARFTPDFNIIAMGLETYSLKAGGLMGVDPEKIEIFFTECRVAAVKSKDYNDFVNVMRAVRTGIICYWVAEPKRSLLHFAAIVRNDDGSFFVCNRYSNRSKPSQVPSIEKLCTEERFVSGYFIS